MDRDTILNISSNIGTSTLNGSGSRLCLPSNESKKPDSCPRVLKEVENLIIAFADTPFTRADQNVNLTVSELIAQKPLFDMVGLDGQVAGIVQQVHDDASNLFNMLQSKLAPSATNSQVTQNFSASLAVFQMAIDVFSGQAAVMPSPAAVPPMMGEGTMNPDGSCNCDVICPAGSFL